MRELYFMVLNVKLLRGAIFMKWCKRIENTNMDKWKYQEIQHLKRECSLKKMMVLIDKKMKESHSR